MSNGIDSLFKEIVRFEERANEHREQLQEAKQMVVQKQKELHEIREENECLTGCLVVKTDQLSQHEATLMCLGIKETVLTEQIVRSTEHKTTTMNDIMQLDQEKEKLRDTFCKHASDFTRKHGLLSDCAWKVREKKCAEKLVDLKRQIQDITEVIRQSEEQLAQVDTISSKLVERRKEIEEKQDTLKEKEEQLVTGRNEIRNLDKQIAELESAPQKAPEFKRLRFEVSRLQRAEADARSEQLRLLQHQQERERQRRHNPWFQERAAM